MTERTFSKPRSGLERDADGHRTGFKVYIKVRRAMKPESFLRWGVRQRTHIGKSRYVWSYYCSSTTMGFPNGIDVEVMKEDQKLVEWLIDYMALSEGEVYALHGWTNAKTKTHVKLTKALMIIEILNIEKKHYRIIKSGKLNKYWFRRKQK